MHGANATCYSVIVGGGRGDEIPLLFINLLKNTSDTLQRLQRLGSLVLLCCNEIDEASTKELCCDP